jgi:hypothetical protein
VNTIPETVARVAVPILPNWGHVDGDDALAGKRVDEVHPLTLGVKPGTRRASPSKTSAIGPAATSPYCDGVVPIIAAVAIVRWWPGAAHHLATTMSPSRQEPDVSA